MKSKKHITLIHKKDGRLHIYVRQDKYKGELKSKNFVGRIYIDGKQKISSSGTPNLEEAIPILEKWFDDIHAENKKEEQVHQETKDVMAMSFYPKEGNPLWEEYSTKVVAHTLEVYSKYTFDYPYPKAVSVHAKNQGMEYPMICWNYGCLLYTSPSPRDS